MGIWAAAISAAVTIGTTAYSASESKKNAATLAAGQKGIAEGFDIGKIESNTISANQKNFKAASNLATDTNRYNFNYLQGYLSKAMPDYKNIVKQESANNLDWLQGTIPQDVSEQVRMNTAEKSIFGGFGGSRMGENLTARDLGLTSLDIQKMGMQSANTQLQTTRQYLLPDLMSPSSMFVTPAQALQAQAAAASAQTNAQMAQAAGAQQSAGQIASGIGSLGSMFSSYMGSRGGGSYTNSSGYTLNANGTTTNPYGSNYPTPRATLNG